MTSDRGSIVTSSEMSHGTKADSTTRRESTNNRDADWKEIQGLLNAGEETQVYSLLWPHLARWAQRISPSDADDIAQEAILLLRARGSAQPILNVRGWLRCVVQNLAITTLRRGKRVRPISEDEACCIPAREEAASEVEFQVDQSRMIELLSWLPGRLRTVLTAFYFDGKSVSDMAASMGRTRQSVRRLLNRGLSLLRSQAASGSAVASNASASVTYQVGVSPNAITSRPARCWPGELP